MMGLPHGPGGDLTNKEKLMLPGLLFIMFTIGPYLAYAGLFLSRIPKLDRLYIFEGEGCLHLIAIGIILIHVGTYIQIIFPQYPLSFIGMFIVIIGIMSVVVG